MSLVFRSGQSAGLFESVLRGKQHPFLEDRREEVITAALLFRQSSWRDGDQSESGTGPHIPDGFAEACRGFQLSLGVLGHNTQVQIAVRLRLATCVRTKKIDCPHSGNAARGLKAFASGSRWLCKPAGRLCNNSFTVNIL